MMKAGEKLPTTTTTAATTSTTTIIQENTIPDKPCPDFQQTLPQSHS
jgi:hypothetical protein